LSPTASSTYSDDYSLYYRRKVASPTRKRCIVKFNSPNAIGVSLEGLLSMKKGCLMDPDHKIMEDWGKKGKPAWINLMVVVSHSITFARLSSDVPPSSEMASRMYSQFK
jgi:hypothetical protein